MIPVALGLSAALLFADSKYEDAVRLRQNGDYSNAERLLKKYSPPTNSDALNSFGKVSWLQDLLEVVHVRALKNEAVHGAEPWNFSEYTPQSRWNSAGADSPAFAGDNCDTLAVYRRFM